jgi:hypothetical protein
MEKPTHNILTNIFYIYDSSVFENEAVPEYELIEAGINPNEPGSFYGFLYIRKGELGWFEDGGFMGVGSYGVRIKEEYVELI